MRVTETKLSHNALADIPNHDGYRFIGKTFDGELIPCIVKKRPTGCHIAVDERDGTPCFSRLESWSKWSKI